MKQGIRFAAVIILLSYSSLALGWGSQGHKIINQSFTIHYPIDTLWFAKYTTYYAAHASDADNRKNQDPNEQYRHFIDIDYYAEFHSAWFPHDLDSLISEYGSSTVYTNGVLPWAIKNDYDSLVAFLKARDTTNANRVIADLGHYIGDAHQPLHCTETYNRKGVHSRYETTMINNYLTQISIVSDTAYYIPDVLDFAFKVIYYSNSKFQMIDDADDSATTAAGSTSSSLYYRIMWSKLDTMTISQLQDASLSLASLVYSAWVDAGYQTQVGVHEVVPTTFQVMGPYPNPFNPSTSVDVSVQSPAHNAKVYVYSVIGKLVKSESVNLQKGNNHITLNFSNLSSGTYLIKIDFLQAGIEQRRTLKAVFLK
jgi:Secretion system C-terminal sorting domain